MVSYVMGTIGAAALWIAFAATIAAIVLLVVGHIQGGKPAVMGGAPKGEATTGLGHVCVFVAMLALLVACAVIVEGFFTHNVALYYVATEYPTDTGSLFWFYQLAGLWAGRAGSLLTWAFLISAFAAYIAWKHRKGSDRLSNIALVVMMFVLVLFIAVMMFSSGNNPFILTDSSYIDEATGALTGQASAWGMNPLLQHWAMAIHPPTLFVGYAGMTVPFAYAIAALVCNDPSKRWVELSQRIALFAFIFLTVGIGLGAVWAYVCLGWGGYWGWDPVENASLLSWLVAVAMIHTFSAYRRRDMMKGWAVFTATLTFVFVVLGTFITRSGLVESVHAFDDDPVSLYLFLAIMLGALVVLLVAWICRHKSFQSTDDIEKVVSKNGSYYLTNLIMVFAGILLAYLTVASALPGWLPAGGLTIGTGAYETVARPLGVILCALAAVCPFLMWKKTDGKQFWHNMRIPLIIAAVLAVLLVGHWAFNLLPAYEANLSQADTVAAADLQNMGPSWYYNGLALIALLVASLLVADSAYLVVRGVRSRMKNKGENAFKALGQLVVKTPAQAGGYLTHLGLGIVLIGLVGSAMYITDRTYIFNEGDTARVGAYTLKLTEANGVTYDEENNRLSDVTVEVSKNGKVVETLNPALKWTAKSYYGQAFVTACTVSNPFEDLFVSYQGYSSAGYIINARINPMISLVWAGFVVMVIGIVCAAFPKRSSVGDQLEVLPGGAAAKKGAKKAVAQAEPAQAASAPSSAASDSAQADGAPEPPASAKE